MRIPVEEADGILDRIEAANVVIERDPENLDFYKEIKVYFGPISSSGYFDPLLACIAAYINGATVDMETNGYEPKDKDPLPVPVFAVKCTSLSQLESAEEKVVQANRDYTQMRFQKEMNIGVTPFVLSSFG